jgi:hypothetical protein
VIFVLNHDFGSGKVLLVRMGNLMRILPVSSVLLESRYRYSVRRVRFEDVSSNATRILYQTDGMLLREAMMDRLLSRFGYFPYLSASFSVRLIL